MTSYLPPHEGLLPLWLLLVAATGFANSVQAYTTLSYTRRVYAGRPPGSRPTNAITTKTSITQSITRDPTEPRRPSIQALAEADSELDTSPVTELSARTFGTWTFLASLVRLYAAYHIDEPAWYQLTLWTFLVAFGHFITECLVYRACTPYGPWLATVSVATVSLIWLASQYSSYVQ